MLVFLANFYEFIFLISGSAELDKCKLAGILRFVSGLQQF